VEVYKPKLLVNGYSSIGIKDKKMVLNTVLLTILIMSIAFAMIATRIILVKNGEFRGICSSNNPMLKNAVGECSVCGKKPEENCKKNELEK
jgi:hypothetical protein